LGVNFGGVICGGVRPTDPSAIKLIPLTPNGELHCEVVALKRLVRTMEEGMERKAGSDFSSMTGKVWVYVDFAPCLSCTLVFGQFKRRFPKISIGLDYSLNY